MDHYIVTELVPGLAGVPLHQAVCSCGWVGHRFIFEGRAEAEGDAHARQPRGTFNHEEEARINAVAALQDILSAVEEGERS